MNLLPKSTTRADAATCLRALTAGAGGTIDSFVKLEGPTRQILQRVLISGDFFITPPRVVFDLEAHLQGSRLAGNRVAHQPVF